eukprot:SAG11_NODE_9_length_28972_cov_81.532539_9_plen_132_part_00
MVKRDRLRALAKGPSSRQRLGILDVALRVLRLIDVDNFDLDDADFAAIGSSSSLTAAQWFDSFVLNVHDVGARFFKFPVSLFPDLVRDGDTDDTTWPDWDKYVWPSQSALVSATGSSEAEDAAADGEPTAE